MSGTDTKVKKVEKPPYKKTDYRYEIWAKERKAIRAKAKKSSFRVESGPQPKSKACVTVDTSKARTTLDVVRLCLKELGWREYPFGKKDGGLCDIYWHAVHFNDASDIPGGKINKFPGMAEIVRKVNLGRSLDIMHRLFPEEFDFHPQQWFLPQQYAEFSDSCRRMNERAEKKHRSRPVFIVKPDEGSQGEGIYLIHEPRDYIFMPTKSHIVQEYIAEPFLLEELKFDFRVYVVLVSLEPLEIYICKEGLARFCTIPYEPPTSKNLHQAFMHLTNYSLNKRSSTYQHTESDDDGSKRTMSSVFRLLESKGYDMDRLWHDIKTLVVKTIIATTPELKVEHRAVLPPHRAGPASFQVLGFDILLDKHCKPMLLEVNANPSLRIDYEKEVSPGIMEHVHSPVDEDIKKPLIMDTLLLMAPKHKVKRRRSNVNSAPDHRLTKGEGRQPLSDKENEDSGEESEGEVKVTKGSFRFRQGYGTLEKIHPSDTSDLYSDLRVVDRVAEIFLDSLGVRSSLRMGPTGFRNFTRRCKITVQGSMFSNAALDIMFIDLQRRWEHVNNSEPSAGLCYQGFMEAFLHLSKKRHATLPLYEGFREFLETCERSAEEERTKRHSGRGSGRVGMFPQISKLERRQEELQAVYGFTGKKKLGTSFFIDYRSLPSTSPAITRDNTTFTTVNDKNNRNSLRKMKKRLGLGHLQDDSETLSKPGE